MYLGIHTCPCMFMSVFRSIFKPVRFNALSQCWSSITISLQRLQANHKPCASVSTSLFLFSLLSFVIFLSHCLRQFPSLTCPQSALITFSSRTQSISLALLSISLFFFPPLLSVTLVCPPCPCLLSFSQVSTLLIAHCFLFFSIVKDLDTEKYIHLVSISL